MKNAMLAVTMTAVATSLLIGSSALGAGDHGSHNDHAARLLERFGDDGIDANGDGELTHEEVMQFFRDTEVGREAHAKHGHADHQGDKAGLHAAHGDNHEHMHMAAMMFHRLDWLSAQAAPQDFDISHAPNADRNGDGVLSNAEWNNFAEQKKSDILSRVLQHHPDVDADEDGTISDEELGDFRTELMGHVYKFVLTNHPEADADKNGTLSNEEFESFKVARMADHAGQILEHHPEADMNGDGELSESEMMTLHENGHKQRSRVHGKHGRKEINVRD